MTSPVEVEPKALAAILEHDGHSIVPLPREIRLRAAMEVSVAARSVRSDDPSSQAFRARLLGVSSILKTEVSERLDESVIIFVDSALPHASLAMIGTQPTIIVCRGLFDLIHFRTALTSICSKLAALDEVPSPLKELSAADAMMLAGQVALFDSYANFRVPASAADVLKGDDARNLDLGVNTSLLLLVLHELGHDELGHTERQAVAANLDIVAVSKDPLTRSRSELEFEADTYAISAIQTDWRPLMLPSLISLLDVFQFLEIFGVRPSPEYPPAGDRLAAMIEQLHLERPEGEFAQSWLADYERRRVKIGASNAKPEAVAEQFDRVLDVVQAYDVIRTLRGELANQSGKSAIKTFSGQKL